MKSLLQVPGLFEGDDYTTLMSQIKDETHRQGLMLDSPDELYKWFTAQVYFTYRLFFVVTFINFISFVFDSFR